MRLPDTEGFIAAAQGALEGHEAVYLHDAEGGEIVAVLLTIDCYLGTCKAGRMLKHDHIEPGAEAPWQA